MKGCKFLIIQEIYSATIILLQIYREKQLDKTRAAIPQVIYHLRPTNPKELHSPPYLKKSI